MASRIRDGEPVSLMDDKSLAVDDDDDDEEEEEDGME